MAGKKFTELMGLTASIVPEKDREPAVTKIKTAPGQMMSLSTQRDDALDRAEKAEAALAELDAKLREQQKQVGYLEIPLNELYKVEGRQRQLTAEERAQLKDNLRQHPLATPITVEVRAEGGFNIVSGSNRVDIYRELDAEYHNKPTIRACLTDATPDAVDDISFFANLLHSSLPAYEKYVGLKKIRNKDLAKPLTHEQLAERTGITRTTVTDLLKFDGLPIEALELLKGKTSALGSKGAAALSALTAKGRSQNVVEAVRRLVSEEISETDAIKAASEEQVKQSARPQPIPIKTGRTIFCKMLGIKKTLRFDFSTEADRVEAETALREVVQRQADRRRQEKD